jgi:hypothetical protein
MADAEPSPCLDEQTLAAFIAGEVARDQLDRITAHLEACADCQLVTAAAAASCGLTASVGGGRAFPDPDAPAAPQPGDVVAGKYQIERALGHGGMGIVFAARHLQLGHLVAIKVLRSSDPTAAPRFLREAKICARFVSEHVPRVFDVGRLPNGAPYFAMEYLAGEDLARRMARGRLPLSVVRQLILKACAAVAEAHAAGILHRDLKPSNLFVLERPDGGLQLKVLDFGISKLVAVDTIATLTDLTQPQAILGSPQYMSPEQIRGSKLLDARSDIWALGVILYELLTGVRPFAGATFSALLIAIATEEAPPPTTIVPDLPEGLEHIVVRCLQKEAALRFGSVIELMEALERVSLHGDATLGSRVAALDVSARRGSGRRLVRRSAAAALGALILAGGIGLHRAGCNPGPRTAAPKSAASVVLGLEASAISTGDGNPFLGSDFYIRREFVSDVAWSIAAHDDLAAQMERVKRRPTASWIVSEDDVESVELVLSAAEKEARETGRPSLPVFVLHDLPDQNCRPGYLLPDAHAQPEALRRYLPNFIEPLARTFAAHAEQRAVVILEPGALVSLAAATRLPCADSASAQLDALTAGVARLSQQQLSIYLDVGAGSYACGDATRSQMAQLVKRVLVGAGGVDEIRGFATNIAAYTPLLGDGARRNAPQNPCDNELTFVAKFSADLATNGIVAKGFVIDTSRNAGTDTGRPGHHCNLIGAGLGERPRAAPRPGIDAYYWIKPPGESDGTDDATAARFNPDCAVDGALRRAPQAGTWFDAYFVELVKNANPPL